MSSKSLLNKEFMILALEEATLAMSEGEIPVGAVIVKDGQVIARAHNEREKGKNPLYHAEILAIDRASKHLGSWRLEDCDMYVTLEPCIMCISACIQSRIRNIYFGAYDEKGGAVCSIANIPDIPRLSHRVFCRGGIMEEECSKLLRDFFKNLRNKEI